MEGENFGKRRMERGGRGRGGGWARSGWGVR